MKTGTKYFFAFIFIFLFCAVVVLSVFCINEIKIIVEKYKNIATFKDIQKANDKLSASKDSLIKLNDRMLADCDANIKNLTKANTGASKVTGFTFGDKHISVEELLKITNNALKENISLKKDIEAKDFKLKVIKDKFGLSYKDTTNKIVLEDNPKSLLNRTSTLNNQVGKLNNQIDSLRSELGLNKTILSLIQRNYNIPYTIKGNTITIQNNKLDSLLDVYPLIKKRIKYKNGKVWVTFL
jgi:hypothetical protein